MAKKQPAPTPEAPKRKAGKPKGAPKTGGRLKGTPNRNSRCFRHALDSAGLHLPSLIIADILLLEEPAHRIVALKDLMAYAYPRLKDIDGDPVAAAARLPAKTADELDDDALEAIANPK